MGNNSNDDIVKDVYAAALDPSRYESIVRKWQDNQVVDFLDGGSLATDSLETHIQFAIDLLGESDRNWEDQQTITMDGEHKSIHPLMRFNKAGQIVESNEAAEQAFAVGIGSSLDQFPFNGGEITDAYRTCLANGEIEIITLTNKINQKITTFIFMPQPDLSVVLHATEFVWPEEFSALLQNTYKLTQSEISVIKLMVESKTPSEIAQARDTGLSTVRSHRRPKPC